MMTYRQLLDGLSDRVRGNGRLLDRPVVISVRDGDGEVHAGSVEALLLSEVVVLRPTLGSSGDWEDDTIVQHLHDVAEDFTASADQTAVFYGLPLLPRLPGLPG